MRIGVISDTHIPRTAQDIPKKIYEEFKNVDLILHAGDFVEIRVLEKLKEIAPVKAVCGNMDEAIIKDTLAQKEIVNIDNKFKIGLIHGSGPPHTLKNFVKTQFSNVNAIIFGHSHNPLNEVEDGVLFFNPGSPTDKVFAPYNSFGILEINDSIKGSIIRL